ncbi:MAG: transcription-repair coupling factor [Phycisphaerae bacterium]|nr:transcription-repair coupling factor [Phycisphaerae bacterium]
MVMVPSIAGDSRLKALRQRLDRRGGVVHVAGLWGSSAPFVAADIARSTPRPILYVTAHLQQADENRDDIELFLGRSVSLLPAWETVPGQGAASSEIEAERIRLCASIAGTGGRSRSGSGDRVPLSPDAGRRPRRTPPRKPPAASHRGDEPPFVIAPIQALMQPVPTFDAIERNTIRLSVGRGSGGEHRTGPETMIRWAVDRGFDRLDLVESPGDIAARGDIVDIFPPGDENPVRIEFFDDEIESIRRFDPATQRSLESMNSLTLTAMPRAKLVDKSAETDLFSYLPTDTLVILDAPTEIQELGELLAARLRGSDRLFSVQSVFRSTQRFDQLHLSRFGSVAIGGEDAFDLGVTSTSRFEGGAREAVEELARLSDDHEILVVCDNDGERSRLREMLAEVSPAAAQRIRLELGVMHHGFHWTRTRTVVVPHHEIFHRQRQKRRIRKLHAGRPLESWLDLQPGEYVVHVVHGIAVYRGLKKLRKGTSNQLEEFLSLEFDEGAMVHVPVSQIDLVQKYIGAGGRRPTLSKIGGKRWGKTKQQVADAVTELAESMLRIQAMRAETAGTAYPDDTEWQREFEAAFLYEETEDQLQVAGEIRGDLMIPRPMDRLICGDVGYGKTELAMRAAFKVVEYGRQVAVLVPTTVLAEQHYETFRERFAEYPFSIGCLSRFRSDREQKIIVEQARRGQIDIVIGTHRLLSRDVSFANLGLVIIDEEQRFGVEHKERLKQMRETVDVLTLTATPIPRTLHMSLVGIRDISALQTPPVDRRAIATYVRSFDRHLIRDAILREMNRDGQIYFLHNYVQSIKTMAATVAEIVPEARVIYGHGQMKDGELEDVMHRFVRREADVLVATTIIESGIDIPTVNTILINRAERFGLADLHQLRGRVGRSSKQAYCYLLLSPDRPPMGKAAKRLKTIEEFSELGAGFRIAMRDLEIRGAGNLLGKEQSGHIAAVGYEMYCRLLEQSVRRLKNEPDPTPPPVHIDLDVAAHIPPHYIRADRSRIEVYRRIVSCRSQADLEQLERDLLDAFGPVPAEFQRLIQVAELRVHARRFGINSISLREPDVIFQVDDLRRAEAVFADAPGSVRLPDAHTIHLRLPPSYMEPDTLLPVLRRMFTRARDPQGAATR